MSHQIYIIVAVDKNHGIGKNGTLPWSLKKEMQFFKETTTTVKDPKKQNMVIMGRKSWESLPEKYRPLPNRANVVLTSQDDYEVEGAAVALSLQEAISLADDNIETIFIIGGGRVYSEAINNPDLTGIYITRIETEYDCDTHFPSIPEEFSSETTLGEIEEDGVYYTFNLLIRQ